MCELLVKAFDNTHMDPVKNLTGCYKQGDVVEIKSDGYAWSSGELDETVFKIIKMTGVAVKEMGHMLVENLNGKEVLNRRKYSIDLMNEKITDKSKV